MSLLLVVYQTTLKHVSVKVYDTSLAVKFAFFPDSLQYFTLFGNQCALALVMVTRPLTEIKVAFLVFCQGAILKSGLIITLKVTDRQVFGIYGWLCYGLEELSRYL